LDHINSYIIHTYIHTYNYLDMLPGHTRGEGILAIHTRVRLKIYTYSIT